MSHFSNVTKYDAAAFGKVAVMFGGDSAEREVSLNSGNAVLAALLRQNVNAIAFDPAKRPLTDLISEKVDRVLIMLHGRGGEDGSMQGALQLLKIPYTGTPVLGSALAMDKIHTKQVWQSLGLPTAKYEIADKRHFEAGKCSAIMDKLGNEVMVKPAREGSSIGMARVTSAEQLENAIQDAFNYDNQVLLEQYINGPEFTVSVIQGQALPSIRELAVAIKVSVITVKRAYQELEREHVIVTRQGLGSFVAEQNQAVVDLKHAELMACVDQVIALANLLDIGQAELLALMAKRIKEER